MFSRAMSALILRHLENASFYSCFVAPVPTLVFVARRQHRSWKVSSIIFVKLWLWFFVDKNRLLDSSAGSAFTHLPKIVMLSKSVSRPDKALCSATADILIAVRELELWVCSLSLSAKASNRFPFVDVIAIFPWYSVNYNWKGQPTADKVFRNDSCIHILLLKVSIVLGNELNKSSQTTG